MSLTLRTELQVELLTAFLNTRGPRAILSSDSYPLDHRCAPLCSLYLLRLLPSGPQSCRYRASFWHSLCASRFIVTALNTGTRGMVRRKVLRVLIKRVRKVSKHR
ncbi:hypothetical protein HETIRDRAFT_330026 [Heterobasidion irregulare TC 32-1]|uniref:Uncharacterized protein n=1 Tax=Heterobasidion irregulare (strain TC 32-1) TaxID=747525 RepID=W4JR95_HETIT|nr:uncharacterized protein HETIRDRAFT_330026 [Heterobasidion irregulare TC 32-1]ETW75984.1 hypothetical protein HETIRDRAFT_330026 [Heterobasidion irregulare TC 32-1]